MSEQKTVNWGALGVDLISKNEVKGLAVMLAFLLALAALKTAERIFAPEPDSQEDHAPMMEGDHDAP